MPRVGLIVLTLLLARPLCGCVVYERPPAPRPEAHWVPGHWEGGYWRPGHWS